MLIKQKDLPAARPGIASYNFKKPDHSEILKNKTAQQYTSQTNRFEDAN